MLIIAEVQAQIITENRLNNAFIHKIHRNTAGGVLLVCLLSSFCRSGLVPYSIT